MSVEIVIEVIQSSDYARVLKFLHLYFYPEEPLIACFQPVEITAEGEEWTMRNICYGTSVMAIEKSLDQCERIVGVMITGPKTKDFAEYLTGAAAKFSNTKYAKIAQIMATVERGANVYERYSVTEALRIFCRAVHFQWRGKGIAIIMLAKIMELARGKGYQVVTSDCTSFYSARTMQRIGFECVYSLYYKDFKDAQGMQIFTPPPPHIGIRSFAKRLESP